MLLTRAEFDDLQARGQLRIALIGMSNIGKSYRSQQLADELEFARFGVDGQIAAQLGQADTNEMAAWFDMPDTDGFAARQTEYLAAEEILTTSIPLIDGQNTILDTTGSVIYLNEAVHDWLRKQFLIVELRVGPSMIARMTEDFFATPKPLVWGDKFHKTAGQSTAAALRECYPQLLDSRMRRYAALADITIDGKISRDAEIDGAEFWQILRDNLA